jgi:hypothetical protein
MRGLRSMTRDAGASPMWPLAGIGAFRTVLVPRGSSKPEWLES